jgi:hypothetical protein
MNIFTNRLKQTLLLAAGLSLVAPVAMANTWTGTANYKATSGATGDEAIVGPFDTYDFGTGIGLIKSSGPIAENSTFTGYFRTMVNGHFLGAQGINVSQLDISGGTNFTGTGNGFELTLISQITGFYSNISAAGINLNVTGGTAKLYSDTTPDYSFANDSGFDDGDLVLSGSITGGTGSILFPGVIGIGVEQVNLDFSGAFGGYDTNVYEPDTIASGSALFSIRTKSVLNPNTPIIDAVWAGSKSVGGISASSIGELAELDGKLQITAVPLPTAVWLFGAGLMSLLAGGKRKKIAL